MRQEGLHSIYISLGSNIQPEKNLVRAVRALAVHAPIEAISSAWESPPADGNGPDFLNAVLHMRSPLPAEELKRELLRPIEERLGRVRTADKNAPRTIDLDILVFDEQAMDDELWTQAHLAVPFAEICPDHMHPEQRVTIASIADRLKETSPIQRRPDVFR